MCTSNECINVVRVSSYQMIYFFPHNSFNYYLIETLLQLHPLYYYFLTISCCIVAV